MTLTVEEVLENNLFINRKIITKLKILQDIGLGYINLFRPIDSLSGGEAQRIKLSKYIGQNLKEKYFLFDEPLIGLSKTDQVNILKLFE